MKFRINIRKLKVSFKSNYLIVTKNKVGGTSARHRRDGRDGTAGA